MSSFAGRVVAAAPDERFCKGRAKRLAVHTGSHSFLGHGCIFLSPPCKALSLGLVFVFSNAGLSEAAFRRGCLQVPMLFASSGGLGWQKGKICSSVLEHNLEGGKQFVKCCKCSFPSSA